MKDLFRILFFGPCFTISILSTLSIIPCQSEAEEFREFTNTGGQKMKAAVTSATDTDVTLKREDGREVSGGVRFFSEADQAYISEWRKANPEQTTYDFSIQFTRERTARTKSVEGHLNVVYETWKYKIKIENRSKSGGSGAPVNGISLLYNLSKTPKSRAKESSSQENKLRSAGGLLIQTGKIDLGTLEYLRVKEFETETIPINHSELAPGWYYANGGKDENNDVLEGISIQLVKDGKTIAEQKTGSKQATEIKWIAPE